MDFSLQALAVLIFFRVTKDTLIHSSLLSPPTLNNALFDTQIHCQATLAHSSELRGQLQPAKILRAQNCNLCKPPVQAAFFQALRIPQEHCALHLACSLVPGSVSISLQQKPSLQARTSFRILAIEPALLPKCASVTIILGISGALIGAREPQEKPQELPSAS